LHNHSVEDIEDAIETLPWARSSCGNSIEFSECIRMSFENEDLCIVEDIADQVTGSIVPFVCAEAIGCSIVFNGGKVSFPFLCRVPVFVTEACVYIPHALIEVV
jgi:hypothetical protein